MEQHQSERCPQQQQPSGLAERGAPCPCPRGQPGAPRAHRHAQGQPPRARRHFCCYGATAFLVKKKKKNKKGKKKSRLSNEPGQKSLRIAFKSITSSPTAEFPLNLNPVE